VKLLVNVAPGASDPVLATKVWLQTSSAHEADEGRSTVRVNVLFGQGKTSLFITVSVYAKAAASVPDCVAGAMVTVGLTGVHTAAALASSMLPKKINHEKTMHRTNLFLPRNISVSLTIN